MTYFRHTNLYAGECTRCRRPVAPGQGLAWKVGGSASWLVIHHDCRPHQKPLMLVREFPDRHKYGEELGINEPLLIATNPKDIAFHLASVLCMARQFRIEE